MVAGSPKQVTAGGGGGGGGGGPGGSYVGGSYVGGSYVGGSDGGSCLCPPICTSESRFVLAASCSCSCSCAASSSCRLKLAASSSASLSCSTIVPSSPNSLLSSKTLSSADESWTEVAVSSIISSAKEEEEEEEGGVCANAAMLVCNEGKTPEDMVNSKRLNSTTDVEIGTMFTILSHIRDYFKYFACLGSEEPSFTFFWYIC